MPNGKPGDHPWSDIVVHGRDVYSPLAAKLVREIAALADETTRRELGDLLFFEYNEFSKPNQALSALLFLYQQVLGYKLPWLDDMVRAKRPVRLPGWREAGSLSRGTLSTSNRTVRRADR